MSLRDDLAAALRSEGMGPEGGSGWAEVAADALVPIVLRYADQQTAKELREEAEWLRTASLRDVPGPPTVWRHLEARAGALDPS